MILKKKLIKLTYEYRIALTITIILIIIVGVWGLGFMLAGDRLEINMHGNILTNSAGQYRFYLINVCALKGSPVTIEDIKIKGYTGLELMATSFYVGSYDDIPFKVEEEELNDFLPMLSDYRGQEISPLPFEEGAVTHIVFVFKITDDYAKGPGLATITYRWGPFKREQSFGRDYTK